MEDARFARFVEDDGSVKYYATCNAFDGYEIASADRNRGLRVLRSRP